MRVSNTRIDGVLAMVPDAFKDHRGSYVEIYDSDHYREVTGGRAFVQDDISTSHQGVLRGIHGDWDTTKLVSVFAGEGYAILADNREGSPTYRRWQSFTLTPENRLQLLIPPGVGNSVLAVKGPLVYWYKQDTHFVPGRQFTIRWDDESWGFEWPIDQPILSERDRVGSYVQPQHPS